jgi:hypothetical protein
MKYKMTTIKNEAKVPPGDPVASITNKHGPPGRLPIIWHTARARPRNRSSVKNKAPALESPNEPLLGFLTTKRVAEEKKRHQTGATTSHDRLEWDKYAHPFDGFQPQRRLKTDHPNKPLLGFTTTKRVGGYQTNTELKCDEV